MDNRKVVVIVAPKVGIHPATGTYVARIRALGLTAYGDSHDDSIRRVNRLLHSDVSAHRKLGTVKTWLDRSGLPWYWLGHQPPALHVEYADGSGTAAPGHSKAKSTELVNEPDYQRPLAA